MAAEPHGTEAVVNDSEETSDHEEFDYLKNLIMVLKFKS